MKYKGAITREYQLVVDFEAHEYDMHCEREELLKFIRIVMNPYVENIDEMSITLKEGAEL